jgi:hypothetical protein
MNPENLIDKCLDLVGLRGRTMANYNMLSAEIKKILGESISAITLYRIASPRKDTYKPFRHSIALLEEFVAQCNYSDNRSLVNNNHYHSSNNPRESALYLLITQLLQDEDWPSLKMFFDQLKTSSSNLGWERYIIAFALADYLREIEPARIKAKFEKTILSHPSFSVFYLETFLDFSEFEVYLNAQRIWLQYNPIAKPFPKAITEHNSLLESWLFSYSIQPYFAALSKSNKRLLECFQVLLVDVSDEIIEQLCRHNPILAARVLGGRMLVAFLLQKQRMYRECADQLSSIYIDLLFAGSNSYEKAFCTVILLDTFLLSNDRERFLHLLKQSHCSVYDHTGDASIERLKLYLDFQHGKKKFEDVSIHSFFLSDGELPFHNAMLRQAKIWFVK